MDYSLQITFPFHDNFWLLDNQFNWVELKYKKKIIISVHIKISSDLQWINEVEDHLQERTEDHYEEEDNKQDDDVVVGLVFLWPGSDVHHQKLMSSYDVESWDN